MSKKKKALLGGGIALASLVLLIYFGFSLFFFNHYYFGTMIGDIDCGGKTPAYVQGRLENEAGRYMLSIQGREGMNAELYAADFELKYIFDDTLQRILQNQKSFAWPVRIWTDEKNDMPILLDYDEALLKKCLDRFSMFNKQMMKAPRDAYIGEYDPKEKEYPIVEEYPGTTLDRKKANEAILQAISVMADEVDLDEADCYVKPRITRDDAELVRFAGILNKYVSSRIEYSWNGVEEIVDGDLIHQWLDVDLERKTVSIREDAVREYINGLSRKNDTFGREREFQTTDGKVITVKHGDYGWRADRAGETENLIQAIQTGASLETKPEYLYTANVEGQDDIGDSYVEINLSSQHLYLYVDGELITDTDFVSGNAARGFQTPEGVYGLTYKTRDAILKGQGYSSPVKYWMPFNGNVGMHDASWRREFGGEIYKRNGSHGCINLPVKEAAKIYEQVYKGFPVICFRDEEYEKEHGGVAKPEPEDEEPAVVPEDTIETLPLPEEMPEEILETESEVNE